MTKFTQCGWNKVDNITIAQIRLNIEVILFIKGMPGQILREIFQQNDFLSFLELADLVWAERDYFESRIIPKCFC